MKFMVYYGFANPTLIIVQALWCMGWESRKKQAELFTLINLPHGYFLSIDFPTDNPSYLRSYRCPSPRLLQNIPFQPVTRKHPLGIQLLPKLNPLPQSRIHLAKLLLRSGRKILSPMRLPAQLLHKVFKSLVVSFPLWWISQEGSIQCSIKIERGARLAGLVEPWYFGLDSGIGNANFDRGVDVDTPRRKGYARTFLVSGEPGLQAAYGLGALFERNCPLFWVLGVPLSRKYETKENKTNKKSMFQKSI